MGKLIAWIAKAVGVRSTYLVVARVVVGGESVGYMDQTIHVAPWIHERNMPAVYQFLADKVPCPTGNLFIVSITRIGA